MTPQQKTVLAEDTDARQLKQVATDLAGSQLAADPAALAPFLGQAGFLARLDPAPAYEGAYTGLRLARVLRNLANNPIPAAREALLELTETPTFEDHVLRIQLLIHNLAVVRPAPPRAIVYWKRYATANGIVAFDVVQALVENQSPPAMTLLESILTNPGHTQSNITAWLRQIILPKRNDIPLLACCHQTLLHPVSNETGVRIVEALFDYDREGWYRSCSPPEPPPFALALPVAREHLEAIGAHGLAHLPLGEKLAAKVKATVKSMHGQKPQ